MAKSEVIIIKLSKQNAEVIGNNMVSNILIQVRNFKNFNTLQKPRKLQLLIIPINKQTTVYPIFALQYRETYWYASKAY